MYFTSNPTIPRDSIIAQLNLDMIGRGGPADESAGGPGYLQIIGARRRSAQLGEVIETVSARGPHRWHLDYSLDAPGHPEQLFCRSDHFSYARFGIPVAFFSTGLHADYHQVTDEVEHLDVAKLARVSVLLRNVVLELANRREPLRRDKPAPDPGAPCVH
jgi:Zn-dependent M28 family amino/carboxypeptidase